jgi:predicted permease
MCPSAAPSSSVRLHYVPVVVLSGLIPVFLLVALGVAARRLGLLSEAAAVGLNRLVANLALPALLLLKIGTADLRQSFSGVLVATTSGVLLATTVVALALAAAWGLRRPQRGVFAQAAMRGNLVYVGFPIILATLGETGLEQAAVTVAVLIPLMNVVSVGVLEAFRGEGARIDARVVLRIVVNPMVVGALGGLVLAALAWHPWSWLRSTLNILSSFALPGALLALGAQLRLGRWAGVWKPAVVASVIKLGIQPALVWWLLGVFGLTGLPAAVGVMLLAAPTAVASYPVAADLGGDTDLAAAAVMLPTIASAVTYVGWALLVH